MPLLWMVATLIVVAFGSLVFSTLTYALRDLSRVRLAEFLEIRRKSHWFEPLADHTDDLILVTAFWRMMFNTAIVVFSLSLVERGIGDRVLAYSLAAILAGVVTLLFSIALPHSLSEYAATQIVAFFAPLLVSMRVVMTPITAGLNVIDEIVRKTAGAPETPEAEHIEQEIMSVVEEGEKEGVVDEQERAMIESVIEFRDTTAGQIMSPRTRIVAIALNSTLDHVRQTIEESGHSRIPVYTETLDQIVGVLYARDLLRFLGQSATKFDLKTVMRPPLYVPESKPSRELLRDFRLQKIHIAVVLDEYSGTAGLVTIEDILEQIVGDISDEHEPVEPAMFRRINETTCDVDAQIDIDELTRLTGLVIPEDGYTTLGGYLSTTLGSIPPIGTVLEQAGAKFTITDAEPAKINRVRIEQALQPVGEGLDASV